MCCPMCLLARGILVIHIKTLRVKSFGRTAINNHVHPWILPWLEHGEKSMVQWINQQETGGFSSHRHQWPIAAWLGGHVFKQLVHQWLCYDPFSTKNPLFKTIYEFYRGLWLPLFSVVITYHLVLTISHWFLLITSQAINYFVITSWW